jgi:hypothetical protein
MKLLWERKLFFDAIEDYDEKMAALKAFIRTLFSLFRSQLYIEEFILKETHGDENIRNFMRDMLEARWEPIKNLFVV